MTADDVKITANDADKNLFFKMIPPYISTHYTYCKYNEIIPTLALLSIIGSDEKDCARNLLPAQSSFLLFF